MKLDSTHSPVAPASDDLLAQEAIKEMVGQSYRDVVGKASRVAERLYDPDQLNLLPPGAIEQALGIGNPIRAAALKPGETVIDLGCGGGIDTILAARAVSAAGKAIGLDMLREMLAVASRHAAEAGVTNVEWVHGYLEEIPLPDASVDVVLSNGVVNLSPRKSRVFAEIHRILRPGGRFALADIVVDEDLPPEILTNPAAWAG